MRNPYQVLGISSEADAAAIRRAYKRLAVEFHPDRNDSPDAVARFKEVSEAYQVLTNERAREQYARRRRHEHAAREEFRRREAAAAWSRSAARSSATATAAEQAFREYARQVKARREQAARSQSAAAKSSSVDWWGDRVGPAFAVLLMAIYVWRSAHGLPLQPLLPSAMFASHGLSSPIWITLTLGLLLVVRPRWCRIPIVMDEIKEIRAVGWAMLLLPPLLSASLLKFTQLGL